ncbi:MAG: winged helix DNA-binding domain-containing protein [Actinomycetota bacterium]|nr:winged helix DNA-binding domain-containing protein [Actinomycetota bacterium]
MDAVRLPLLRAHSQLLHRPDAETDVPAVLRAIGGAQAQEPRSGRLQVRARTPGSLTAADVEHARVEDRSVIRAWVMRKTAHLFPTEDLDWMAPIFWGRIADWSRGRLEALGVDEALREKALKAMRKTLESRGGMTRSEVLKEAARAGVEVDVERRTHLSVLAVVEGWACIGPRVGSESAFVSTRDWIGTWRPRGREGALAELARRYLAAFAPATERDFAYWAGLPLGDCRLGLEAIAKEIREVGAVGGGTLLVPRAWRPAAAGRAAVRLLGAYDTYLMGYASRRHAVSAEWEKSVLPGGGVLRPTICIDGRFAGTWRSKRSGNRLEVELEPFKPLADAILDAIEAEVADLGRFEAVEARLVKL